MTGPQDSDEVDYYVHCSPELRERERLRLLLALERHVRRNLGLSPPGRCLAVTGRHRDDECLGCLMADLATLDPRQNIPGSWMAL